MSWRLEGEVRQADDGVHRRADFVAHVRQEHGLHLRGFLGLGFCLAQFLGTSRFWSLISTSSPIKPPGLPSRELESVHRVKRDVRLAIRVLNRQLITAAARLADDGHVLLVELAPLGLRQVIQFQHGLALEEIAGGAKLALVSLVAPDESALGILDEHRVRDRLDERLLKRQSVGQFLFRHLELGDVLRHAVHVRGLAVRVLHDMPQGMDPDHAPVHGPLVGVDRRRKPGSFPPRRPAKFSAVALAAASSPSRTCSAQCSSV